MAHQIVRALPDAAAARADAARMQSQYAGEHFSVVFSVENRPCPYLVVRHDVTDDLSSKVLISLAGAVVAVDKRVISLAADERIAI